jgi:hypothetical protein
MKRCVDRLVRQSHARHHDWFVRSFYYSLEKKNISWRTYSLETWFKITGISVLCTISLITIRILWSILGIKWMKTRESTTTPRVFERYVPGPSASGAPDPQRTSVSAPSFGIPTPRTHTSNRVQSCDPVPTTNLQQCVITQMRINNI